MWPSSTRILIQTPARQRHRLRAEPPPEERREADRQLRQSAIVSQPRQNVPQGNREGKERELLLLPDDNPYGRRVWRRKSRKNTRSPRRRCCTRSSPSSRKEATWASRRVCCSRSWSWATTPGCWRTCSPTRRPRPARSKTSKTSASCATPKTSTSWPCPVATCASDSTAQTKYAKTKNTASVPSAETVGHVLTRNREVHPHERTVTVIALRHGFIWLARTQLKPWLVI